MEKTFITMHDLSSDARVVYASDTITDVLGYLPTEVTGLSCFDFFHPEELPFARKIHGRGVHLDKAAMLVYCRVKHKDGRYVDCETIFSIVYDVFVAATSLHVRTSKSQGRALTAPVIRRVFSSSSNDPRYHMLTHLSTKFRMNRPPQEQHEPRAALILNRFTRSLSVLYASHALESIFGMAPDEVIGKSFFEFISENCLQNAVDALERAKENDSIAYLRFFWRDPRSITPSLRRSSRLTSQAKRKRDENDESMDPAIMSTSRKHPRRRLAAVKGNSTLPSADAGTETSTSTTSLSKGVAVSSRTGERIAVPEEEIGSSRQSTEGESVIEVEAVVSCTSDGLVVILRRARPLIPKPLHDVGNGVYASPWASSPLVPSVGNSTFRDKASESTFMETIREVAVFAWSLRELGGEIIIPEKEKAYINQVDGSPISGSSSPKQAGKHVDGSLDHDQGQPSEPLLDGESGKASFVLEDGEVKDPEPTTSIMSAASRLLATVKSSLLPSPSLEASPSVSADPSPALSASGSSSSASSGNTTDTSLSSRSRSRDTQNTDLSPVSKVDNAKADVADAFGGKDLHVIAEEAQRSSAFTST